MKVLLFTNSYYPILGGIENVVENLSNQIKKSKIETEILTLNNVRGKKLSPVGKHNEIKITRLPFLDLKYYKISTIPWKIIKNYDLIHIHTLGFFCDFLLLTKPLHRKKIVISTHGGFFHTNSVPLLKKIYFNIFEKLLFKNADAVIADSKNDFNIFKKIYPNIKLIENGISLPNPHGKKEKNRFLTVGRFSKNKRIDLLLDAFAPLKNSKLVIVGNDFDNLYYGLKEKVRRLNIEKRVEFKINASENQLYSEYNKAEYLISASEYEGFGITVIEAMHFGCATILNNIPTFKEFAGNGRGNIVDFKKSNITKQITQVMKKNKSTQIESAKNYAKTFNWKNKAKEFIEVYNRCMDE
jgi:alpha-1,3-mannosyltransferase